MKPAPPDQGGHHASRSGLGAHVPPARLRGSSLRPAQADRLKKAGGQAGPRMTSYEKRAEARPERKTHRTAPTRVSVIAASTTAPIIKRAKPPGANPNTAFRMYHGMVESQYAFASRRIRPLLKAIAIPIDDVPINPPAALMMMSFIHCLF